VSLLHETDLVAAADDARRYDGDELTMLSVGRLDPEKNPLLLADVLCRALAADQRWRLEICGDGTLTDALTERAAALGVGDRLVQRGLRPDRRRTVGLLSERPRAGARLDDRGGAAVILEAFAARLPVVATDVGGVGDLVAGRGS